MEGGQSPGFETGAFLASAKNKNTKKEKVVVFCFIRKKKKEHRDEE